jgi:hypothetical protein
MPRRRRQINQNGRTWWCWCVFEVWVRDNLYFMYIIYSVITHRPCEAWDFGQPLITISLITRRERRKRRKIGVGAPSSDCCCCWHGSGQSGSGQSGSAHINAQSVTFQNNFRSVFERQNNFRSVWYCFVAYSFGHKTSYNLTKLDKLVVNKNVKKPPKKHPFSHFCSQLFLNLSNFVKL